MQRNQNKFAKLGVWRVWKDSPHFWYLIWDFNPPILTYLWNNFLFHSCVSEIFRIERWDRKYLSTKKNSKFEFRRIRISSNLFSSFEISMLESSHIYEIFLIKFMCDRKSFESRDEIELVSSGKKFEIRIFRISNLVKFVFWVRTLRLLQNFQSSTPHICF